MQYIFPPEIQEKIALGLLKQVFTQKGEQLPLSRDPETGRFVKIAVGIASSLTPTTFPLQIITNGLQMFMNGWQIYQTYKGFSEVRGDIREVQDDINTGFNEVRGDIRETRDDINKGFTEVQYTLTDIKNSLYNGMSGIKELQQTVGVLQATTAVIGVGVFANLAISAVSLRQVLKLREDVRQMRLEIKDGFIDLKQALKEQGVEVLNHIDQVAQDIKFEQHRLVLIHAYSNFIAATKLMQSAVECEDIKIKNQDLANARQMLAAGLADYRNSQLLSETSALGKLRRMECAWAIEQTIATTYQIQRQTGAVANVLSNLQASIRQDIVDVSNSIQSQEEMDLIYPEIKRICTQDLAVISAWQEQIGWVQSLSASDLKLLESSELNEVNIELTSDSLNDLEMPEQKLYNDIKPKSHFESLRDQLQLMAMPNLRLKYESYVVEKSQLAGHKALKMSNLDQASDMTVANLYYYFQANA